MNWLLKTVVFIAAALVFGIVGALTASYLGIEVSGSTGARAVQNMVELALAWGLLLIYLEFCRTGAT